MVRKISKFAGKFGLLFLALLIGLAACSPAPAPAAPAAEPTKAEAAAMEPTMAEAAAPAAAAGEKKVLAVFMPSADHGFTAESIQQAKAELETLAKEKGFEFKQVTSAEASDQANQVATVLEGKVDTVLLWPIDGAPLRSAAQSIMDKKIPLVVYDRLIPDFKPDAEMTGDQITIGTQAAKYFNTYFADQLKSGKVSILEFQGDTSLAAQERSSSFKDNKDPNLEIVQSFVTNWQRDVGRQQMETFLSSSKVEDIEKIQAIYTHDDEPMLGILDAIRSYTGPAKLNIKVLTGVGAQKAVLDEMQKAKDENGIDVLSYTYAPGMIRLAVDLAVDTLEGKGKTGLQLVPVEEIRLDNQAEYRKSAEYMHRYEEGVGAPAAAAEPAAPAEMKTLAVFMPSADHGFTAESIQQAKAELETLAKEKGFEFKQVTSAEASDQANQVATVLEGKVDTVLLWPIDGAPLRSAAQSIMDKKIPLVVYDRLIPDFKPDAEMTGDQITIGTQAAKYFNTYFADQLKSGKVSILEFQGDTSLAAQERSSSFKDNKDPNLEIVQSFVTNWQRDVGRQQMETFLSSSKVEDIEKIQAIYTHDDEPMLGILDAIRSYTGPAKLNIKVLTGVGAQKAVLDEMQKAKDENGIDVLSYTYAPGMIRLAVDLAVDTMYGKGKTGLQLVPVEEIRLDNQAEYRKSAEYMHRYEEKMQ